MKKLSLIILLIFVQRSIIYAQDLDNLQNQSKSYIYNINDSTKRLNKSILTDTLQLKKIASTMNANVFMQWIKNFNQYNTPPEKNKWTLYYIKARDTLNAPFLVYVPKNYNPHKKNSLYVYLHGAASGRNQFSIASQIPISEAKVLKKPLLENAIIIYPYSRKDINWLFHQDAFETIEKEIAFVKSLYNVDDNRIYVGGHSDGGRGALWFATNKPTNFAAALGICYFPSAAFGNTHLRNLKNTMPFYGISGTKDFLFSIDMVEDIWKYAKSNHANWNFYAINGNHGLPFDYPDSTFFVYNEVFRNTRNPFPKKIEWETSDIKNGRNAWIEIKALDTSASIADWHSQLNPIVKENRKQVPLPFIKSRSGAVIAKASGNELKILTSRVKKLTLYISADMFDLSKQLQVKINNKPPLNFELKIDKAILLDEFLKHKDRVFIVANKIELTIE
jgi:predicted esterase